LDSFDVQKTHNWLFSMPAFTILTHAAMSIRLLQGAPFPSYAVWATAFMQYTPGLQVMLRAAIRMARMRTAYAARTLTALATYDCISLMARMRAHGRHLGQRPAGVAGQRRFRHAAHLFAHACPSLTAAALPDLRARPVAHEASVRRPAPVQHVQIAAGRAL
jgi:hypothetical protein